MKHKIIMFIGFLFVFSFSQQADSINIIGKWVSNTVDTCPTIHTIRDIWRIYENYYEDTVYHIYKNNKKILSGCSKGLWYVKKDTLYYMDTLTIDANGKRIIYDKNEYFGDHIIKINSNTLTVEEPVGIVTYKKIK